MKSIHKVRTNSFAIETLEERRLLTGLVTATLGLDATLSIRGDSANNSIVVERPAGTALYRVRGIGTAVNGVSQADFPGASVARISIDLRDGNDSAGISGVTLPDRLTITDDKGNDSYTIRTPFSAGTLNITTGGGNDLVDIIVNSVGSTSINTGSGIDTVLFGPGAFGSASVLTGDDADRLIFFANSTFGTLTADSGNGDDNISLFGVTVSGNMNIKAGDGFDFVHADNTVVGSGLIDGGSKSDVFEDGGNNSGFATINFEGYLFAFGPGPQDASD